ncbi:MAG: YceI family protein [Chitinophagaceae bacterium]|jgi:polyisoprenoid-binding protein YceI|nr:YceI family protein [Chitinophagaceae bacterium]
MKSMFLKSSATVLMIMGASQLFAAPKPSGRFVVNAQQTTLSWNAKKVTGEHSGLVPVSSGVIEVNNGTVKSGNFTMNLAGLTVTDIKDAGTNAKLVGHLKSDDFFSTEKHPNSTFVVTGIAAGSQAGSYTVKGNLTIKGITQAIEFPASILVDGKTLKAAANITVDRTKFDIRYGSKSFFESIGDKAIYDDFTLSLQLVATQQ